ncbi:MAG: tripartite tricarboxylate transporter substrate binding protein [Burkholderiales bacterium]|nr:tripartite tricarboxylate transporter substrate binding protein [Burkholderiales bacterium]
MNHDRPAAARRAVLRGAVAVGAALAAGPGRAQSYPARPLRLVVPYPAGGAVDIVSRLLAEKLAGAFGQQVIVENRAGAAGLIGAEAVARMPADGYALVMATVSSHAIAPSVYRKMPYDPVADFSPITLTAATPYVITVNPGVAATSLQALIALAKANPTALAFGSSGNGTTPHLAGELFNTLAGTTLTHVPYKGSAPMVTDLIGGQVQVAFDNTVIPHVKAGRLRALAVTGPTRLAALPEVPTAQEAGLAGYEAVGWMGLFGPRGLPAEVAARVQAETARAMRAPDVTERLAGLGFQAVTNTPEALRAYVEAEIAKWARVVRQARIQPE